MRLTAHEITLIVIVALIFTTGVIVRAYRLARQTATQENISLPKR